MRILFLCENFIPETKSASVLFYELAESLVKCSHSVTVLTRLPRYNIADGIDLLKIPEREKLSGIDVVRFKTPLLARHIPLIRGLEHFILGWLAFWNGLRLGSFEAILVYSPPLPLGIGGWGLGKVKRCPVVVNIQDLYPQTVIDLKLLSNPALIWVAKKMEEFIYKRSGFLTVHSDGNKDYLISRGAPESKVKVVHNWGDCDNIRPGNKNNDFFRKYGLAGHFIVSFAGVMGFAQGLEVVLKAAEILRSYKDILFILVGEGVKMPELMAYAREKTLANVKFIPTQPRDIYPQVLHVSDVGLVTLNKSLVTPVVPGKLLSIMAAGKPVIASLPLAGDTPKIIRQAGCGLVVPPEDPEQLARAVLKLYNQRGACEEMGKRGRQAAESMFSRQKGVDEYADIFNTLQKVQV